MQNAVPLSIGTVMPDILVICKQYALVITKPMMQYEQNWLQNLNKIAVDKKISP